MKAGAARSTWSGVQAFVCTLVLKKAHGWHEKGTREKNTTELTGKDGAAIVPVLNVTINRG